MVLAKNLIVYLQGYCGEKPVVATVFLAYLISMVLLFGSGKKKATTEEAAAVPVEPAASEIKETVSEVSNCCFSLNDDKTLASFLIESN